MDYLRKIKRPIKEVLDSRLLCDLLLALSQNKNKNKKTPNKVVIKVEALVSRFKKHKLKRVNNNNNNNNNKMQQRVNFMEKDNPSKKRGCRYISIWDLGGQEDLSILMPLVCSEARVVLFAFDLTAKQSLHSVKTYGTKKRGKKIKKKKGGGTDGKIPLKKKKKSNDTYLQTFFFKKKKRCLCHS
ncbi:GTP binding protein (SPG1) [Reticulomyxa filosa]|uniref:GTP binding protein (SPG1) n=1 Tax=Reticulomyxa filosa TaxID=46433 RepID=X6M0G9_RETFI|nr:GTP binding protein (SPG1) [Reticulomyxa filosa]|eukprot:ETO06877.1 GTP binding protein (SPG1) [Reticulomyxa filosa]